MAFGSDIKRLREDVNISAQKLADLIGVKAERLRKWEQLDLTPRDEDTILIEKFFGMSLDAVANLESIKNFIIVPNNEAAIKEGKIGTTENESNAKALGHEIGTYRNRSGNEFIELSNGSYIMTTPLVTQKAYAGYLTGWGDEEYLSELPKHSIPVEKPHSGDYISIQVVGQSMNDGTNRSFLPGDIATGRKIDRRHWRDSKLHLKKFNEFIIVHKRGILIKEIIEHSTIKNSITIHSYNPDKNEFPDEVIKLEDVMQIFNVVKNTRDRSNKH